MRENQKIKYSNIVFVILLITGLSLIIARSTPQVRLVKNFIYFAAYPNAYAADRIFQSAGTFADNLKAMVYLRQENLFYKQKNQELADKLRNYDAMASRYETLAALLNVPKIKRTKSVFARVSVREPHDWYQWFIIDKGSDDGLCNDLPVTMLRDNGELCAVGRIVETHKNSAKVALITNSLSAVPVEIKGKNINCLAEGFNSNVLKITYIPAGADVKVGDEVIASPLSSVFGEGMPVGIISAVSAGEESDFKTAVSDILFESGALYEAVVLVPDETK
ncbi:MAG: rod shape-determining protein MreC [Endomicrobia bacterium]|nr:rod shape-determining protein MreC [Endomicrobiia bacterium]